MWLKVFETFPILRWSLSSFILHLGRLATRSGPKQIWWTQHSKGVKLPKYVRKGQTTSSWFSWDSCPGGRQLLRWTGHTSNSPSWTFSPQPAPAGSCVKSILDIQPRQVSHGWSLHWQLNAAAFINDPKKELFSWAFLKLPKHKILSRLNLWLFRANVKDKRRKYKFLTMAMKEGIAL